MRERNPDILRCSWCDARQRNRTLLNEHEAEHRRAEMTMQEAGRSLKDSRAMAERLAATVEIEEQRARGERLERVLP